MTLSQIAIPALILFIIAVCAVILCPWPGRGDNDND